MSAGKGDAAKAGAGDGPVSARPAAAELPVGMDVSEGGDSWGDDSPVLPQPSASRPSSQAGPEPQAESKPQAEPEPKMEHEMEPEVERADAASEDSWGDSDGSPILPGSPTEPVPARRTSGGAWEDISPIRSAGGGTGTPERTDDDPPSRRRSGVGPAEVQRAQDAAKKVEGEGEGEEEDISSWGDVSPVLPRSPADLLRESRTGTDNSSPAVRGGSAGRAESPRRTVETGPPPAAQVEEADSWGDMSPVLHRSPAGPEALHNPSTPTAQTAAEPTEEADSWGEEVSASPQKAGSESARQPAVEESWGDVSPILPRQSVQAGSQTIRRSVTEDSWGDQDSLPSEPDGAAADAVAGGRTTDAGMSNRGTKMVGSRAPSPERPSEDDSWGDDSLSGMGQPDSRDMPTTRQTIHKPQNEVNVTFSRKTSREESGPAKVAQVDKFVDEISWNAHANSTNDKSTCKLGTGHDFEEARNPEQHGKSNKKISESTAAGPSADSELQDDAQDSSGWDDSSSAGDNGVDGGGGGSARLDSPPPAEPNVWGKLESRPVLKPLTRLKPLTGPEPSNRPGFSTRPESPTGPETSDRPGSSSGPGSPTVPGPQEPPDEPDDDSWDSSSAAEPVIRPHRQQPAPPELGAVTSPVRPARGRSVTLLSPPRSRETSASETADRSQTQVRVQSCCGI